MFNKTREKSQGREGTRRTRGCLSGGTRPEMVFHSSSFRRFCVGEGRGGGVGGAGRDYVAVAHAVVPFGCVMDWFPLQMCHQMCPTSSRKRAESWKGGGERGRKGGKTLSSVSEERETDREKESLPIL